MTYEEAARKLAEMVPDGATAYVTFRRGVNGSEYDKAPVIGMDVHSHRIMIAHVYGAHSYDSALSEVASQLGVSDRNESEAPKMDIKSETATAATVTAS